MKQMTINAYAIEELKGKARDHAFYEVKSILIDNNFNDFNDRLKDFIKYDLNINGKAYYSLSHSQGDGLMIESSFFNSDEVINLLTLEESIKAYVKKLSSQGLLTVKTKGHHHYHYAAKNQVEVIIIDEVNNLLPDHMKTVIEDAFINFYLKTCQDLAQEGYKAYDVSDEEVITFCQDNDYAYLEDGRLL